MTNLKKWKEALYEEIYSVVNDVVDNLLLPYLIENKLEFIIIENEGYSINKNGISVNVPANLKEHLEFEIFPDFYLWEFIDDISFEDPK